MLRLLKKVRNAFELVCLIWAGVIFLYGIVQMFKDTGEYMLILEEKLRKRYSR